MKKPLRVRDIFLKWADPKRKDMFQCSFTDNVFIAERVPTAFQWNHKTDGSKCWCNPKIIKVLKEVK